MPNLPTTRAEMRIYHLELIENCMEVSNRKDEAEKEFLDKVMTLDLSKERDRTKLDYVPKKMMLFDRRLKTKLIASCKPDQILFHEIRQKKLQLSTEKKLITARRVLAMIYARLSTDSTVLGVVTIKSLAEMKWASYGDTNMEMFFCPLDR